MKSIKFIILITAVVVLNSAASAFYLNKTAYNMSSKPIRLHLYAIAQSNPWPKDIPGQVSCDYITGNLNSQDTKMVYSISFGLNSNSNKIGVGIGSYNPWIPVIPFIRAYNNNNNGQNSMSVAAELELFGTVPSDNWPDVVTGIESGVAGLNFYLKFGLGFFL